MGTYLRLYRFHETLLNWDNTEPELEYERENLRRAVGLFVGKKFIYDYFYWELFIGMGYLFFYDENVIYNMGTVSGTTDYVEPLDLRLLRLP